MPPAETTKRYDPHCSPSTWQLTHDDDSRFSDEVVSVRPPEILSGIMQIAVGQDGNVRRLLPFTHVSTQWRRAALDDSSLWTTIHLKETTAPLLDAILERASDQLFTVHVDHHDFGRLAKLWKLVDRIEELHYSAGYRELLPFLSSLGPAPNLKVLHLRPEYNVGIDGVLHLAYLPKILSGCLPSLRDLALTYTIAWQAGQFSGLVSLECGPFDRYPVSLLHLLDTLHRSPSLETLRLVGCMAPDEGFNPSVIAIPLRSLKRCVLVGDGTANLIEYLTIPPTTLVFLSKSYPDEPSITRPNFNDHSVEPALRTLGEISAVSFSITDRAAWLQAKNDVGGVLEVEVDGLVDLSGDPLNFVHFIRTSIACWRTCPGFKTTKKFTLSIDRGSVWKPQEAACCAVDLTWALYNLPGIEVVILQGIPPPELSLIIGFLSRMAMFKLPCPKLRRLDIESSSLHSPRLLLVELGKLLAARKEAGAPFRSVTVKVKCEMLIPAAEHRSFLTSWKSLVTGSASLEYERIRLEEVHPRICLEKDGVQGEGVEGDGCPGGRCVGWDGWPGEWPKTVK